MSENRNWERKYEEMTVEELERRYRETFFYTDKIDETVYLELERLGAALEKKRHVEFALTAEESWEQFSRLHAGEIARCCAGAAKTKRAGKTGRYRAGVRVVLIAAVVMVLLAGAVLAADSLGLVAWVPRWNAVSGRYEPAAQEVSGESPVPAALAELGITEPVYPARLPEGFVITESHISEDPLVLMEQYARGDQHISITITPIKGFKSIVYQKQREAIREYQAGTAIHYILSSERNITALWYTKNYTTTISGDVSLDDLKKIIDSIYER